MNQKRVSYVLMPVLVLLWGLDYSIAKNALELFRPLNLMFFKYAGGLVVITVIKLLVDRKFTVRKKDIGLFILCSVVGQVMYYFCEYTAMDYISVSLITIILAFVPIVSIITERIFFKKRFSLKLVLELIVCVAGIAIVIGADFSVLLHGRAVGYILAFGAVLCWNTYNFLTAKISEGYTAFTMAFNQLFCTVLISLPYAVAVMPPAEYFTREIIGSIAYLGIGSAGLGYMILVRGLRDLGPTIPSLFINFLPVASTVFGFLILGESLSLLQIAGGIIVVAASCFVIMERAKQTAGQSCPDEAATDATDKTYKD